MDSQYAVFAIFTAHLDKRLLNLGQELAGSHAHGLYKTYFILYQQFIEITNKIF